MREESNYLQRLHTFSEIKSIKPLKMKKGQKTNPEILKVNSESNRRNFIRKTTLGALGLTIVPRSVLGRGFVAPSDRIGIGVIGLGKQISGLTGNFMKEPAAEILACCDVW